MRRLNNLEISKAHGGMDELAKVCIEGTGIGAAVGGVLGAIATSPIYYTLTSREGISSSHQLAGMFVVGVGVVAGALFGSMIGGSSSYLAACQYESDGV